MRRLRTLVFVLLAAIAGAAAGRLFAEARRRAEAGEDPTAIDLESVRLRPQDVVPGVVAAFRVGEAPWSWLHVPTWLAAFAVNFGAAALAGDLQKIRATFEESGLADFGGHGGTRQPAETYVTTSTNGDSAPVWTAPDAPPDRPDAEPRGSAGFTPFRD
ncbi:MAG: hypothetical protein GEU80_11045 [Dehalococcoidia bacterium]|nr:hypothetical protein [Dehalococcoidia bacterium]